MELPPAALQAFAALLAGERPSHYKLADIAAMVQGQLVGDGDVAIATLAHPKYVTNPAKSLVVIIDSAIIPLLDAAVQQSGQPIPAALVADNIQLPDNLVVNQLRHPRPRLALGILLKLFHQPPVIEQGIHPTAVIDPSATLGEGVTIGAYATVGANTTIGANTTLMSHVTVGSDVRIGEDNLYHPGVRVGDGCQLGNRVQLQPNVVIGGDGFSYVTPKAGSIETAQSSGGQAVSQNTDILKIESIGNVIIEDDVEIGANATVDRANLGPTLIKRGTKIDNLVQVGHNNTIGELCLIAAQTGISGSCQIGDRVVMGGQVGTKDHLTIGDDAILMARTAVMNDVPKGDIQAGVPGVHHREAFKNVAAVRQIPELRKTIRDLSKRLTALEAELAQGAEAANNNELAVGVN